MTALLILVSLLVPLALGFLFLCLFWPGNSSVLADLPFKCCLSAGFDFGISSCIAFVWLLLAEPLDARALRLSIGLARGINACSKNDSGLGMSPLSLPRPCAEPAMPVTATDNNESTKQSALLNEGENCGNLERSASGERTGRVKFNTEDLPNLDFLRACAVLFVLGSHLIEYFQLNIRGPMNFYEIGRWGVLIFFVHTTLVLFFSLERQVSHPTHQKSGCFWPFLIRRIFRILPLSVFVVCLVELCGLPVGHLRNDHFIPVHLKLPGLLSNIFLVQNITHTDSATAPLWTLPYEMQMYLVLPVLFLLVRSGNFLLPISCLWLAGILAMQHARGLAEYHLPDFILFVPYFLPGILAYKWMSVSKIRLPSVIWPIALAAITVFYLRFPSDIHGAVCCVMLGLTIPLFAQLPQIGIVKVAQMIARYSYGIYLTHFICIWLAFQALDGLFRVEQWIVFFILLLLIPVTLYHLIEAPMIRVGRRLAARLC